MSNLCNGVPNTDLKHQFTKKVNRMLDEELKKCAKKSNYDNIEGLT